MGILDCILGKMQQVNNQIMEAQMESEDWSVHIIVDQLHKTSSVAKTTGYSQTLRRKCRELGDAELQAVFDRAYERRNAAACNAIFSLMSERGLVYRDEDGIMRRTY